MEIIIVYLGGCWGNIVSDFILKEFFSQLGNDKDICLHQYTFR